MSRDGKDIGDIKDLVVNMAAGKVHYAALAFDPSWAAPAELYAFPLRDFNLTADRDDLVLDVDKSKVHAMKKFDAKRWDELNDRVWVADMDHYLVTVSVTAMDSPAAIFTRLDANKDDFLNEAEAKEDTGVNSAWKQLDKNSDRKISRSEFTSNYKMER
ncbi:MAG: PRC-barrel domain-containing protein [Variovorax sp.]